MTEAEFARAATASAPTSHAALRAWVEEWAALLEPERVHWCDGSEEESEQLSAGLVAAGTFVRLNDELRPNSYWARSDPGDVARVEDRTFICSATREDAGPTNNWRDPDAMRSELRALFAGAMRGRTLYVVPFSMGPLGSRIAHIGVQLTDSAYVAVSMGVMTRMGAAALAQLGDDGEFVPCVHSLGAPLAPGQADVPWPCNERKAIAHFPESREIWSFGSGYGGNALLGKKCFALRIASVMAHEQGWLAEHMLILKLTAPSARCTTSRARSPRPAARRIWPCSCRPSRAGRSRRSATTSPGCASAPTGGCRRSIPRPASSASRRAPAQHEPERHGHALEQHRLHQHGADARGRHVVGGHDAGAAAAPHRLARRRPGRPRAAHRAAHPNARFTVPAAQCPSIAPEWEDPAGVPISAILFGGRRAATVPLVYEARSWEHGVFVGATMASETTAAAAGAVGNLRRDPFAMLPFCGYHMGDYFAHWLALGAAADRAQLPRIFQVNWFRKDADNRYLWPGFGENSRVLAWIAERCEGTADAVETADRPRPRPGRLPLDGLDLDRGDSSRCWPSTSTAGRPSCRSWPSISRASATACRRSC